MFLPILIQINGTEKSLSAYVQTGLWGVQTPLIFKSY